MYKRKEEHGYVKDCEANQGSDDLSLNTIMIKYKFFFFLNQKKKAIFHKLMKKKKKKITKQSFLFSLSDSKKRSNSTDFQALFLKIKPIIQAAKQINVT